MPGRYKRAAIRAVVVVVSALALSGLLSPGEVDVVDHLAGSGESRRRLRNHSKWHTPFEFLTTSHLPSYDDPKSTEARQVEEAIEPSDGPPRNQTIEPESRPTVEYVTDPQNMDRLRRTPPTVSVSREVKEGGSLDMLTIDVLSIGSETRIDYVSCDMCSRFSPPYAATVFF